METLHITANDDGTVSVHNDSELNVGRALGLCIDGLESILTHIVSNLKEDPYSINQTHDYTSYALTSVLERVFPDSEEFTFTDAAVYKAQNELLEESIKEGVPIEELIEKYNKMAQEYLEERRN